ncbi:MAG TPA: hypothetical protein VMR41_03220 [Patescibacteria group bacterium]|nr:hypothetical protein [Patescibacteria group bacterium]
MVDTIGSQRGNLMIDFEAKYEEGNLLYSKGIKVRTHRGRGIVRSTLGFLYLYLRRVLGHCPNKNLLLRVRGAKRPSLAPLFVLFLSTNVFAQEPNTVYNTADPNFKTVELRRSIPCYDFVAKSITSYGYDAAWSFVNYVVRDNAGYFYDGNTDLNYDFPHPSLPFIISSQSSVAINNIPMMDVQLVWFSSYESDSAICDYVNKMKKSYSDVYDIGIDCPGNNKTNAGKLTDAQMSLFMWFFCGLVCGGLFCWGVFFNK